MIALSLKDFKWDKKNNILDICSDSFKENIWVEIVINRREFVVESHVTGVKIRYIQSNITFDPNDLTKWAMIECRPMIQGLPIIWIHPPKLT